jgi:hypothetical protein
MPGRPCSNSGVRCRKSSWATEQGRRDVAAAVALISNTPTAVTVATRMWHESANSAPGRGLSTRGRAPNTAASVVMRTGRKRSDTDKAIKLLQPSLRYEVASRPGGQ